MDGGGVPALPGIAAPSTPDGIPVSGTTYPPEGSLTLEMQKSGPSGGSDYPFLGLQQDKFVRTRA